MNHFYTSILISFIILSIYIYTSIDINNIYEKNNINKYIGIISISFIICYYLLFDTTNIDKLIVTPNINSPHAPF